MQKGFLEFTWTGTPVEFKRFKKENMGAGKRLKWESVVEMANVKEECTEFGFLKTTIKLQSFTFFPEELLS